MHVHTQHIADAPPGQGEFVGVLFRRASVADVPAAAATQTVSSLLSPRLWTVLPAMGLGFTIGSSTNVLDELLALTSPSLRRGVGLVLVIPVWEVIVLALSIGRDRRFAANELPKLRAAMDATPARSQPCNCAYRHPRNPPAPRPVRRSADIEMPGTHRACDHRRWLFRRSQSALTGGLLKSERVGKSVACRLSAPRRTVHR